MPLTPKDTPENEGKDEQLFLPIDFIEAGHQFNIGDTVFIDNVPYVLVEELC